MVAQNTVRTYGVNQVFRFVEGIWLHRNRKSLQIRFRKRSILLPTCATCFELPSYTSTMMDTESCVCQTDNEIQEGTKITSISVFLFIMWTEIFPCAFCV